MRNSEPEEGGSLRVISRKALVDFWARHPQAQQPLVAWYQIVRHTAWESWSELRTAFPSADRVGRLTVFNIGGNKYRLIARVEYRLQRLYVRQVLTHDEYNKNEWKKDPWY
jgi:mRNA interferase HigB